MLCHCNRFFVCLFLCFEYEVRVHFLYFCLYLYFRYVFLSSRFAAIRTMHISRRRLCMERKRYVSKYIAKQQHFTRSSIYADMLRYNYIHNWIYGLCRCITREYMPFINGNQIQLNFFPSNFRKSTDVNWI